MKRTGFMFADALTAVFILAAATALLAGTLSLSFKANRTIADQRVALRIANEALLSLQTGVAPPESDSVKIVDLDTPAPAGWRWVCVVATHHKSHAEVTGLARKQS